ncbi:MAG: SMI1/KNR4 family protein [Clostridia bacterium]|nr:SMI1/KNR4 family protein [Clostridia bacterium]
MEIWNSPYEGEDVREVHGIALPQDYIDFLRLHNGGEVNNLKRKPRPGVLKFPSWELVFFSMEDILGEEYYPIDDIWLSSRYSIGGTYQNLYTQTRTTRMGTDRHDAPHLYKLFFDTHVVIGYYAWWIREQYYRFDLIAIDKEGRYRVLRDGMAESVPKHRFGSTVTHKYGSYVTYNYCLYETPIGLLEFGVKNRQVSREELEELKAKYDKYIGPLHTGPVEWKYAHKQKEPDPWAGRTIDDVLAFFHNGKRNTH